jgi:threonine synthase
VTLSFACTACEHTTPINLHTSRCPDCAAPLNFSESTPFAASTFQDSLDDAARGVWRYRRLLPIAPDVTPITLGEGATPIVDLPRWGAANGLRRLQAKLEQLSPTGSFKDRGATLLFTALAAAGVRGVIEDSSGNAGAAAAAYAARAGIAARIFVPESAPPAKIAQIASYGAKIILIAGSRQDVTVAAEASINDDGVHASHNWSPYFPAGLKTFAYELVEQLRMRLPTHIVFPVGNGGLLLGAAQGIADLARLASLERMPHLHAAQAANCAPIVHRHQHGSSASGPEIRSTIAGGVAVTDPPRITEILAALKMSEGTAIAVTEERIRESTESLARHEGLYVEPTSAVAFAAAIQLRRDGIIGADDTILIPVTGSGLKDPLTSA